MPVGEMVPEPLKSALEEMEAKVQEAKSSLAYGAPEMHDQFWIRLQQGLAETMAELAGYEFVDGEIREKEDN